MPGVHGWPRESSHKERELNTKNSLAKGFRKKFEKFFPGASGVALGYMPRHVAKPENANLHENACGTHAFSHLPGGVPQKMRESPLRVLWLKRRNFLGLGREARVRLSRYLPTEVPLRGVRGRGGERPTRHTRRPLSPTLPRVASVLSPPTAEALGGPRTGNALAGSPPPHLPPEVGRDAVGT